MQPEGEGAVAVLLFIVLGGIVALARAVLGDKFTSFNVICAAAFLSVLILVIAVISCYRSAKREKKEKEKAEAILASDGEK